MLSFYRIAELDLTQGAKTLFEANLVSDRHFEKGIALAISAEIRIGRFLRIQAQESLKVGLKIDEPIAVSPDIPLGYGMSPELDDEMNHLRAEAVSNTQFQYYVYGLYSLKPYSLYGDRALLLVGEHYGKEFRITFWNQEHDSEGTLFHNLFRRADVFRYNEHVWDDLKFVQLVMEV